MRMDPDTASPPAHHGSKSRRRTSLPAPVQTPDLARPAKRTPNYIRTQAASPQVISSLIDQLSAISIPAHNHFENLLVGYDDRPSLPPSPSIPTHSGRASFTGHDGHSLDQGAHYHSLRDYNDLYPDDACEPPVIRTSKPPSGLSPLTAPKKQRDKPHSLSSYIGRSGGSSCSLQSAHSNRSASSFGAISIEAPAGKQIAGGSTRSSAESKRSAKGHRSLMYMSSRERLRQKETERKRNTLHTLDDFSSQDPSRKAAPQLFPYEDTIKEEPNAKEEQTPHRTESTRFSQRYPSRNSSPRRLRINLVDDPPGESPPERGLIAELIPDRGSSLRHSGSPSRKSKRRKSPEKQREKPRHAEAEITPIKGEKKTNSVSAMEESLLKELEQEENEVAQRIRVLKEQKMRREILAGRMPVDAGTGASPPHPTRVSPNPSPEASPTSTVSCASEKRMQHPTKAHRVLGIALDAPMPGDVKGPPVQPRDIRYSEPPPVLPARSMHHSRHRSLTLNDGDAPTSYPINYALAIQRLEEPVPLSPVFEPSQTATSPPASADSASIRSNPSVIKRASSMAVGGRSALGRRTATDSVLMGSFPKHKHSTSVTDVTLGRLSPAPRSISSDVSGRHHSMLASSSPVSNSLQLQRKRTLTKKRWSHPDLPVKAEKAHNAKMERTEAKASATVVQTPPRPVVEDRPVSLDSIDLDVQSYLSSPRLSQKIRHPETGRIISFSEVGDPEGYAIFVCVGMGLTRFVMAFYDQLATTLKLRLITPDRPGIGGSQVDPTGTPLSWPDDVLIICQALKISKFSLLAHSAGAIYALATSLRMPQHIRGRVHLLAPWIPPSQMAPIGISQDSPPTQQLPRSQRFLRALPPSLLKVANSTFLSATSASLQRTGPKNAPKTKRKSTTPQVVQPSRPSLKDDRRQSMMLMDQVLPNANSLTLTNPADPNYEETKRLQEALTLAERERQRAFDERLTFAIWDRATANANPATDLIVCLETKQTIGFRYEDINRPVVIHHGSKDSRVPRTPMRRKTSEKLRSQMSFTNLQHAREHYQQQQQQQQLHQQQQMLF
ncbi:alpha/beta-hydrolase [Plenodomus tracheiphilus IPT5]|uniref:Alpha/beta-hydrolase n=1 Tax=Plenodomus tracheiphilus IPT5 TaxID=1408161 RepID=A0A6A7BN25_9PLEO|nr:alpha/beta-hydrolase [Plenodomus tracheiphilus IPT5]